MAAGVHCRLVPTSPGGILPLTRTEQAMDIKSSHISEHLGASHPGAAHTGAPHNVARPWRESVSPGMRTVEAVIRELSQNDVPVLVVAESGSGKRAAAARIHALSIRGLEPFRECHASQATCDLLATWNEDGGTAYLQDVGDLDSSAQAELVRQI